MPQVEINETTGIATVAVSTTVAEVIVDDQATPPVVQVVASSAPQIIEIGVVGPQGPPGGGSSSLSDLTDVNIAAKVDKSILVYDQSSQKFIANDVNTIVTITDGGNF